jgi:hypothetical protein
MKGEGCCLCFAMSGRSLGRCELHLADQIAASHGKCDEQDDPFQHGTQITELGLLRAITRRPAEI